MFQRLCKFLPLMPGNAAAAVLRAPKLLDARGRSPPIQLKKGQGSVRLEAFSLATRLPYLLRPRRRRRLPLRLRESEGDFASLSDAAAPPLLLLLGAAPSGLAAPFVFAGPLPDTRATLLPQTTHCTAVIDAHNRFLAT